MPALDIARVLQSIEPQALHKLARRLLEKGQSPEDTAMAVAALLDLMIPLDLVPVAGPLLEVLDGELLEIVAVGIVRGVERSRKRKGAGDVGR